MCTIQNDVRSVFLPRSAQHLTERPPTAGFSPSGAERWETLGDCPPAQRPERLRPPGAEGPPEESKCSGHCICRGGTGAPLFCNYLCVDAVLQRGDGDAASHCHRSDRMEPAPHCHETRQATPVASLMCAVVIAKRLGPTDHVTSGMCGLRKGSSRAHEHVTGNPGGRGLVGTHVRQGKATWRYGP